MKGGKKIKKKMVKQTKKEKLKELLKKASLKKASTPTSEVNKEIEETNQMVQDAVDAGKGAIPKLDSPKLPKTEKEVKVEGLVDEETKWIEDAIVKDLERDVIEENLTNAKYPKEKIESMLDYFDDLVERLDDTVDAGEESSAKPIVKINPLSDDAIFRNEYLVRLDFQNQQLFKIVQALEKK